MLEIILPSPLRKHLIHDLGMLSAIGDPSLYAKFDNYVLIRVSGVQVDDSINAESTAFEQITQRRSKR